jgi:hypothetical protein
MDFLVDIHSTSYHRSHLFDLGQGNSSTHYPPTTREQSRGTFVQIPIPLDPSTGLYSLYSLTTSTAPHVPFGPIPSCPRVFGVRYHLPSPLDILFTLYWKLQRINQYFRSPLHFARTRRNIRLTTWWSTYGVVCSQSQKIDSSR